MITSEPWSDDEQDSGVLQEVPTQKARIPYGEVYYDEMTGKHLRRTRAPTPAPTREVSVREDDFEINRANPRLAQLQVPASQDLAPAVHDDVRSAGPRPVERSQFDRDQDQRARIASGVVENQFMVGDKSRRQQAPEKPSEPSDGQVFVAPTKEDTTVPQPAPIMGTEEQDPNRTAPQERMLSLVQQMNADSSQRNDGEMGRLMVAPAGGVDQPRDVREQKIVAHGSGGQDSRPQGNLAHAGADVAAPNADPRSTKREAVKGVVVKRTPWQAPQNLQRPEHGGGVVARAQVPTQSGAPRQDQTRKTTWQKSGTRQLAGAQFFGQRAPKRAERTTRALPGQRVTAGWAAGHRRTSRATRARGQTVRLNRPATKTAVSAAAHARSVRQSWGATRTPTTLQLPGRAAASEVSAESSKAEGAKRADSQVAAIPRRVEPTAAPAPRSAAGVHVPAERSERLVTPLNLVAPSTNVAAERKAEAGESHVDRSAPQQPTHQTHQTQAAAATHSQQAERSTREPTRRNVGATIRLQPSAAAAAQRPAFQHATADLSSHTPATHTRATNHLTPQASRTTRAEAPSREDAPRNIVRYVNSVASVAGQVNRDTSDRRAETVVQPPAAPPSFEQRERAQQPVAERHKDHLEAQRNARGDQGIRHTRRLTEQEHMSLGRVQETAQGRKKDISVPTKRLFTPLF